MICTPTSLKRRALLTLLLLHANRRFPICTLIGELWDGRPPPSAVATVQMYVSGLRRVLDPGHSREGGDARRHPLLLTDGNGYLLRVRPGELDLDRFRTTAGLGRELRAAGDCAAAARSFHQALALWRGTPPGDLGQSCLPAHYTVRLEEERLALVHDRIGADICSGRAREVVGELEELCARHALREDFHEQLMLALAAAGRSAEALNAYARARRTLVENTGVEPGPGLRSAQQALLSGARPDNARHDRCRPARVLREAALDG
ncbi:AfsR/SARP family transcriptional regulator [Streptomyces xanthophaeus]|uniref:AfsR/SARP family transcriptional regulator n=1 Tax=Streptomyces xanthophaeus TaxID=67385 RepID=UPI00386961DE|nr:AfsR/SARP family transcriptional regulator [Streptomyces xanthophaeus]WST64547.1 AfsR/SARP family transcriptional regulator [Streptomyces xanthophaeus]